MIGLYLKGNSKTNETLFSKVLELTLEQVKKRRPETMLWANLKAQDSEQCDVLAALVIQSAAEYRAITADDLTHGFFLYRNPDDENVIHCFFPFKYES